jgi:hypothetical protein
MGRRAALSVGLLLGAATALQGCAALAVPVIGSAAASGSAGVLVRAGAASVKNGAVYRTFDASLHDVHAAVLTTAARLQLPAPEEKVDHERVTLHTAGIERQVRIDLQPITPALTQIRVAAAIGVFQDDTATATTLVDLVAKALEPERSVVAP